MPAAVLGHSLGEIAAAHIAGVLPLSEATRIAVLRGRLMQAVEAGGGMAAVELSADEGRKLFKTVYPALCIAAVNGPRSITVSGDEGDVDRLVAELTGRSVFARRLTVNRAFHSPAMAAAAGELSAKLQGLSPAQSSIPFFSTVDGRIRDGRTLNAEYWGRNISERVQFASATSAALDAACNVFLEVGPHPVLAGALQQCADAASRQVTILASLRPVHDERTTLLQSLGSLYAAGGDIHWKALYPSAPRPVSLPNYPWQRERHWAAAATGVLMESLEVARWPGRELRSAFLVPHILESIVSANQPEFVGQHRVCGVATVPLTASLIWLSERQAMLCRVAIRRLTFWWNHSALNRPFASPKKSAVGCRLDSKTRPTRQDRFASFPSRLPPPMSMKTGPARDRQSALALGHAVRGGLELGGDDAGRGAVRCVWNPSRLRHTLKNCGSAA